MMKIRWVLVLLFFVSFLSTKAMACSCSQPLDDINVAVQEAYTGSASVVLARAENIQQLGGGDGQGDDFDVEREITQFSEIQSWKGEHGTQFYTNIITECCLCGVKFELGKTYLLYLYSVEGENTYAASSCSRTMLADKAQEDIEILNALISENEGGVEDQKLSLQQEEPPCDNH